MSPAKNNNLIMFKGASFVISTLRYDLDIDLNCSKVLDDVAVTVAKCLK